MPSDFNASFVGLQIKWDDDEEVEYLGPAVLFGSSSYTAASCRRGHNRIQYLYPVTSCRFQTRTILKYEENPTQWRTEWGWEVCKGRLSIDFGNGPDQPPTLVEFTNEDENLPDAELEPGVDWVYRASADIPAELGLQRRGRLQISRWERPLQRFLRNLLISEHGRCQVTGTECPMALEACHILPVKNGGQEILENALLLRRDIHALFDGGMLKFRFKNGHWRVKLDPSIEDQVYVALENEPISNLLASARIYLEARAKLECSND